MKQFAILVALAATVFGTDSVSALQNQQAKLSPMVLVELKASMKADMLYAERMVRLDIRDELQAESVKLAKETIKAPVTYVLKRTDGNDFAWSTAADE